VLPYADTEFAALYDLFFFDYTDDLVMHEQFARRGDTPSLEIGAGSGRLALHLARSGLDVVALDSSAAMLDRLRRSLDEDMRSRIRVVEADMREFSLGEHFDTIHCAVNTFQHLTSTEEQLACLSSVAAHLSPGGVFIAKVAAPSTVDWSGDESLRLRSTRLDPASAETVMRFDSTRAMANEQIVQRTYVYDRVRVDGSVRRRIYEFPMRFTTPSELSLLLEKAGMRLLHLYGNFELSTFDEHSDSMIIVGGLEG
jgi:SAM-dependent methyltransferase